MEVEVDAARTGIKQEVASNAHTPTNMQDIPDKVYDDCQKAFTAAQNISKASNKLFADTAIMALVCRHDCPLLLVNMTSPGERQHYALALLHEFFQQLPNDWDIGLLYDIACQLRRSMQKVCTVLIKDHQYSNITGISLAILLSTSTVSPLPSPCFTLMVTNGPVSLYITLVNALDLV